jgi:hypothetical protein
MSATADYFMVAIAFEIGSTGNGKDPIFNGRRQPSCGDTSRMTRECQVRICERLGVKFPGPTRPGLLSGDVRIHGESWRVSGPPRGVVPAVIVGLWSVAAQWRRYTCVRS